MKYRVILLGLGFFGSRWFDIINNDADCTLVAATGTPEEVECIRARGVDIDFPVYADYKEAISKSEADIAVIVIPAAFHTDAAKMALAKGMHVLSEKPLTFDRKDALDMLKTMTFYHDRYYVVDQNYRWRPHNVKVKKLLEAGIVGELRSITCEFRRPEDLIGYRVDLEMPFLQDVSIHHFDLIRYFSNKNCKRILARSYHVPWSKFSGRASSDVLLEMEDGLFVNYTGTWTGRGKPTTWDGKFTFMGDKGCLTLDDDSTITFYAADGEHSQVVEPEPLEYEELAECFHQLKCAIEGGAPPQTRIEDNINSFLMVCAAEKSAASGEWTVCN